MRRRTHFPRLDQNKHLQQMLERIERSQQTFDQPFYIDPGIESKKRWWESLPRTTKRYYFLLLSMSRLYKVINISHIRASQILGVHRDTIKKASQYLRRCGIIKAMEVRDRANFYRVYDIFYSDSKKIGVNLLQAKTVNQEKTPHIKLSFFETNLLGRLPRFFININNQIIRFQKESFAFQNLAQGMSKLVPWFARVTPESIFYRRKEDPEFISSPICFNLTPE